MHNSIDSYLVLKKLFASDKTIFGVENHRARSCDRLTTRMIVSVVRMPQDTTSAQINQAAECLEQTWPTITKEPGRTRNILNYRSDEQSFGLMEGVECIGYAKLQPVNDNGEGRQCAVTSVVIKNEKRGCGHGNLLMQEIETFARNMGYFYIVLWTSTAEKFYFKLGYRKSEKVNLDEPVFSLLEENGLSSLETMLRKRTNVSSLEIWMKKRLIECVSSLTRNQDEITAQLPEYGMAKFVNVPWQQQIGPSCGLTALRMVMDYFEMELPQSLLTYAKQHHFTEDGELYDITSLKIVAQEACKLNCYIRKFQNESDFQQVATWINSGYLVIFPYDRGLGTSQPACYQGRHAHYCIITGMLQSSRIKFQFVNTLFADADTVFVAQHGMSRKLVTGTATEWFQSNCQLSGKADLLRLSCLVIEGPS